MSKERKIAIIVGVLYLTGNIIGPIGFSFELPILDAPDFLANIAANETKWLLGILLQVVLGVSVVGIGIMMYPILKKYNPFTAIGYVTARIFEGVIDAIGIILVLTLLSLSQEYIAAGSPVDSFYQTIGNLLLEARGWAGHVILDVAVFHIGTLFFYLLLYKTKLVPRWLSGVGLVTVVMSWAAGFLVMFDAIVPLSAPHIALQAPVGIQELVFALWLIVKGFNPAVISPEEA